MSRNPTSGEYMLDGERISDLSQNEIAKLRNEKLGIVFQHNGLLDSENVYENVKIPLLFSKKYKLREMRATAYSAIDSIGIYDLAKKKVKNLSGGQKQRVAIARALVNNPDIILADEPTSALDSGTASEIIDLFNSLNKRGKTIIIVTHDINVAKKMKRIIHIVDGIISDEPVSNMQITAEEEVLPTTSDTTAESTQEMLAAE